MSWTNSLSTRVNSLPLVLCGPILRNIDVSGTTHKVSVFVVLKEAKTNMSLVIYKSDGTEHFRVDGISTKQIGSKIHAALLTATSTTSTTLAVDKLYYYNVIFSGTENLSTASGVLPIGLNLDYTATSVAALSKLPSFSIPPTAINDLKIAHCSCRKPHGEGKEMLSALDRILTDSLSSGTESAKANARPHLLMMTGDQIYADDVADGLLFMLQDAANNLIGSTWSETLPSGITTGDARLKIGKRDKLIKVSGLSSTESKSHLIYLKEFLMMYMFAWSDCLWPVNTSFPIAEDVYDDLANLTQTDDVYKRTYNAYKGEVEGLKEYRSTLQKVQRALANIPTYMILDDHEVTDDLFFDHEWCNAVINNTSSDGDFVTGIGKRITQNGLTAYSIFQAWGNPNNSAIETFITYLSGHLTGSADFSLFTPYVMPNYTVATKTLSANATNGLTWHYNIVFPKFEIKVLDARTLRSFNNHKFFPSLLSDSTINTQIDFINASRELSFVVFPGPAVGIDSVENLAKLLSRRNLGFSTRNSRLNYDDEALSFVKKTFQKIFARMASKSPVPAIAATSLGYAQTRPVILLSGDVHYGFTQRLTYWMEKDYSNSNVSKKAQTVFIQFTSSSLKNELGKTRFLQSTGYSGRGNTQIEPQDKYAGWNNLTNRKVGNNSNGDGIFASKDVPNMIKNMELNVLAAYDSGQTPEWLYRIDRIEGCDQVALSAIATGAAGDDVYAYNDAQGKQLLYARRKHIKEIVGVNNLGLISFQNWANNNGTAIQDLYWKYEKETTPEYQQTRYLATLDCEVTGSFQRPGPTIP